MNLLLLLPSQYLYDNQLKIEYLTILKSKKSMCYVHATYVAYVSFYRMVWELPGRTRIIYLQSNYSSNLSTQALCCVAQSLSNGHNFRRPNYAKKPSERKRSQRCRNTLNECKMLRINLGSRYLKTGYVNQVSSRLLINRPQHRTYAF